MVIKGEDKLEHGAEKRGRGGPFISRAEHSGSCLGAAKPQAGPFAFWQRWRCRPAWLYPGRAQVLQEEGWQVMLITNGLQALEEAYWGGWWAEPAPPCPTSLFQSSLERTQALALLHPFLELLKSCFSNAEGARGLFTLGEAVQAPRPHLPPSSCQRALTSWLSGQLYGVHWSASDVELPEREILGTQPSQRTWLLLSGFGGQAGHGCQLSHRRGCRRSKLHRVPSFFCRSASLCFSVVLPPPCPQQHPWAPH